MPSLATIPTVDSIPTMPAGLTPGAQQKLTGLALSLRGHFTSPQQTAVQIALLTFRLIKIIGDSRKAHAYLAQRTGEAPSTFRTDGGVELEIAR